MVETPTPSTGPGDDPPPRADRAAPGAPVSPQPRQRWRNRPTWQLLATAWIAQAAVVYFSLGAILVHAGTVKGSPDPARRAPDWDPVGSFKLGEYLDLLVSPQYLLTCLVAAGALAIAQSIFLIPVRKPRPARARGIPIFASLAVVGVGITALVAGLFAAIANVLNRYGYPLHLDSALLPFLVLVPTWIAATLLLWRYCRRAPREALLAHVASRLFRGTIIEFVALIPLDIMLRRREDCYCLSGTLVAFIICGGVGLFALGPAIILPILLHRRHSWYASHCESCAYDMTSTPSADRCPECGGAWRPA